MMSARRSKDSRFCEDWLMGHWLTSEFNVNCLISFAGHYLNALNMRDGESSSFPSATQPLNPNNPYSPDGKSLLTVETHLLTDVAGRLTLPCVTRLYRDGTGIYYIASVSERAINALN